MRQLSPRSEQVREGRQECLGASNGSREVGNMPRNIPDAIFPVSGRHMHDGVEENQPSLLPLPPLHTPASFAKQEHIARSYDGEPKDGW